MVILENFTNNFMGYYSSNREMRSQKRFGICLQPTFEFVSEFKFKLNSFNLFVLLNFNLTIDLF